MKRQRGDAWAVGGIFLGAALAWSTTVTAAAWVSGRAAYPASEALVAGPAGVAFRASSLNSMALVQGDYGGRLTREGDGLRLRVPVAQIRNSTDYGREDALLVGIRLLLVEYGSKGERVVREGRLYPVQELLTPGETLWLQDLQLVLDDVTEEEAEDRSLVIEQVLGGDAPWAPRSLTYVDAAQEVLWLLFDWEVEGC